ncbi:MAG: hypothetical protein AB3K77_11970 [Methanosarcinaceae archaeon]
MTGTKVAEAKSAVAKTQKQKNSKTKKQKNKKTQKNINNFS